MLQRILLMITLCLVVAQVLAQDQSDSSRVFQPSLDDSTAFQDTADTALADSLTKAERAARGFEERMQKFRTEQKRAATKPVFSAFDTLAVHLTSPRLNQRRWLDRSFAFDAGDYFKLDPGYFTLDYFPGPMRTTVQPYGLMGNRLNLIRNGELMQPFDIVPEPEGMVDLADFPTTFADSIYILPGAAGMILGGDQAIASLLTIPSLPAGKKISSGLFLDKGMDGYSFARGKYANRFSDGRVIDMSVGYRVYNDPYAGQGNRMEDAYQYDGTVLWPIGQTYAVSLDGYLYDREGTFKVVPSARGETSNRDRFDRSLQASILRFDDSMTSRTELGYQHSRQGAYWTNGYQGVFNNTENGAFFGRDWIAGNIILRTKGIVNSEEFTNGYEELSRITGEGSFLMALPFGASRIAALAGIRYVEAVRALPFGAVMWLRESEKSMYLISAGYAERAPSLYEWYLPFRANFLYGDQTFPYGEVGNPKLEPERQVTGSLRAEWGKPESAFRLEVNSGYIFNGIEWRQRLAPDFPGTPWLFSPINTDVRYATATLTKQFAFGDYLSFLGGGSYHFIDYDSLENRPYQPEYQVFSGLELHYFWRQKLMHFWAYGEVMFVGPYEGYAQTQLGEQAIVNGKLSFSMGNFRFRVIYQNVIKASLQQREGIFSSDWMITWGFTWNFFD